jgi:uncharacterized membrane protein
MYEIPILHPLVVHFPIAFLFLAALTSLIWLAGGAPFWRNVMLILLIAGFVGGLGAYFTGGAAEKFAEGSRRLELFGEQHETLALLTLVAAGLALFVLSAYLGAYTRRLPTQPGDKDLMAVRIIVTVLVLAAAVLVGRTGHLGGLMVWGQPVGGASAATSGEQAEPAPAPQEGEARD